MSISYSNLTLTGQIRSYISEIKPPPPILPPGTFTNTNEELLAPYSLSSLPELPAFYNGDMDVLATYALSSLPQLPAFYNGDMDVLAPYTLSNSIDPDWASVSMLLHCDGANASTLFPEAKGHVMTVVGNAQVSTSVPKFGTGSLKLDGAGDYLSTPYASNLDLETGDFTIEFWFKTSRTGAGNTNYMPLIACFDGVGSTGVSAIQYQVLMSFTTVGQISVYANETIYLTGTYNDGIWHHFAFVRNGDIYTGYVDGISRGTFTLAGDLNTNNFQTWIGGYMGFGLPYYFTGNMDEIRISKMARYTADFTPPTIPFPN